MLVELNAANGNQESKSTVVDKEIIIEAKTTSAQKKVTTKAVTSNGKLSFASIIKAPASSTPAAQSFSVAPKPDLKTPQYPTQAVRAPAPNSSIVKEPSNVTAASQNVDRKLSVARKDNDQKGTSFQMFCHFIKIYYVYADLFYR